MEKKYKYVHKRAISQIKPHGIEHEDLLFIQKFKPIEYNSKVAINVKMPKVRMDFKLPKKVRQFSESPLKNLVKIVKNTKSPEDTITTPQIYLTKKSSQKFEPKKESMKLVLFSGDFINKPKFLMKDTSTQENLPRITRQKLPKLEKTPNSHGIYFELLGFFIKKHLDYSPAYKRIDTDNKGFIDRYDMKNYFYLNSLSCNVEEVVENIFILCNSISADSIIMKKTFFGLCSSFEYDFPFSYRCFVGENFLNLKSRIHDLKHLFGEFTSTQVISKEDLESVCMHLEDHGADKALELVTTECVDFPRFLVCLPFFMWLKAVTDYKT